ncbi:acyl-CoA N-acyltransferase [Obba rivulosa]|uniref:Acyl-CoA N-acyltransferase n=1 Tax=Obba rivulosa TaxID=1052685 RepID=A0A8E2DG55_9APHY|nr:acyl-CoA N-acyltransferase [Obba rivulosa]
MAGATFVNSCIPPSVSRILPESELYGPDPYDVNWAFPINLDVLSTDEVFLTPFVPRLHADAYWEQVGRHPEFFKYYPFLHPTLPGFLAFLETRFRQNPEYIMFAIVDRTRADAARPQLRGRLAGVMGFFSASRADLSVEIAHVLVFPEWRGTGVGARAAALLTRFCLQLPTASPPGLGLRRVQWVADSDNKPSIGLARRLGMTEEAHLRWHRVLPEGLPGKAPREGDAHPSGNSRDSVILSICCDEWEEGGRDNMQALIEKPLKIRN